MPQNLTEVDEFTADIAVPVGSDTRSAASVRVPFQGLANRTRRHHNLIDVVQGRTIPINICAGSTPSASTSVITFGGAFAVNFASNSAIWIMKLDLPNSVTISGLEISVTQGNAGGSGQMSAQIWRNSRAAGGGVGFIAQLGTTKTFSIGAGDRVEAITVASLGLIQNETYDYFFFVSASALAGTNADVFRWARASVMDPRAGIER